MSNSPWSVNGAVVCYRRDRLEAYFDAERPERGLGQLRCGMSPLDGATVLGIRRPAGVAAAADLLIRGEECRATYAESPQWPVELGVAWRESAIEVTQPPLAAIELRLTVRTSRLDCHPEIEVASQFAAQAVYGADDAEARAFGRIDGGGRTITKPSVTKPSVAPPTAAAPCFAFRLADGVTYAEMAHPADIGQAVLTVGSAGEAATRSRFFADPLEKGVALRMRMLGAFFASADLDAVGQFYRAFIAAELPLSD